MTTAKELAAALIGAAALALSAAAAQDACDFGAPHPSMPDELAQYEFLIGDFEVHIHVWTGEAWSEGFQKARWTGRYILGGRAVMDEWYPFDPADDPDTPGGVNVRMYDPAEGLWKLMWMRSDELVPTELRSRVEDDGRMHLWRVYPTPEDRDVRFETIDADTWARVDRVRDDAGAWAPRYRFEARRLPCP